jgi:hypothetical protein
VVKMCVSGPRYRLPHPTRTHPSPPPHATAC